MNWVNESTDKKSIYTTTIEGRYFLAQKEKQGGVWRLFTRDGDEPLRVIYTATTLKDLKTYAGIFGGN